MYAESILRKPVLFPVHTASEKRITHGFPIAPNNGERIDHPHHYGIWFNHGIVNDVDYWNSAVIPKSPDVRYGRINHLKFLKVESYENFHKMLFETVQFSPDGSRILYSYPCVLHDFVRIAEKVDQFEIR